MTAGSRRITGRLRNGPFFSGSTSPASASRTYDIFNHNGWGRSLHFLDAWFLVLAGAIYLVGGALTGHFRRHVMPRPADLLGPTFWADVREHVRLRIRAATGGPDYGPLQKCTYVGVVFLALPLIAVTGLAMSPAIGAAYADRMLQRASADVRQRSANGRYVDVRCS